MSAGTVMVRRADDGTFRVVLVVDARFRSVEEADGAAHYVAQHLRIRLADVFERVRQAAEEPLGEALPRPVPAPTFRAPD